MNLEQRFLNDYSPELLKEALSLVEERPEIFDELVELFYKGPYRLTQRVSNALLTCVQKQCDLFVPHFPKAIEALQKDEPVGIRRNLVRIIKEVPIPEEHQGLMMEICFDLFGKPLEPVTIRYYSLIIIYNLVKEIPELGHELKLVLEEHLPFAERAIVQKGKNILEELGE